MAPLLSNMLWFAPEHLSAQELEDSRNLLTITPAMFAGAKEEPEPIVTYVEKEGWFGVPLFWGLRVCRNRGLNPLDDRTQGRTIVVRKCPKPWEAMIPGQAQLFKDTLQSLRERPSVITEAGTGTGKTACTCHAIYHLRRAAVIVVPTTAAADHWREELAKHNGLKPEEIGMVGDGKEVWKRCAVTIMILNSAAEKELPDEFFKDIGLVVFDEAHRLGARMFSKALSRFHSRYRLGLTATPDRKDGCMEIVTNALGKPCAILGGEALPCRVYSLTYKRRFWRSDPNDIPLAILINILSKDQHRNAMLAQQLASLYRKGRQPIGVGDRLEQLNYIRALLINTHKVPEKMVGLFVGDTDEAERARIRQHCKIILGTSKMLKESVDIPRMDAGMELLPMADGVQLIGRVRRPMEGKKKPIWFTTLDTGIGIFKGFHTKRLRDWEASGCAID